MRMAVVFFFSSRRRHTRWPRDWSSDVCSSDLRWYQVDTSQIWSARGQAQVFRLELDVGALVRAQQVDDGDGLTFEGFGEYIARLGLNRPVTLRGACAKRGLGPDGKVADQNLLHGDHLRYRLHDIMALACLHCRYWSLHPNRVASRRADQCIHSSVVTASMYQIGRAHV